MGLLANLSVGLLLCLAETRSSVKLIEFDLASAPVDHVATTDSGYTIVVGPGESTWDVQVFAANDRERTDNLLLPPASEWENWAGIGSIESWVFPTPDDVTSFPGNDRKIGVRGSGHSLRIQLIRPKSGWRKKIYSFTSGRMRITWYE